MLEEQLKKSFGLSEFRKGQREIINAVLSKQDALAVLPTGGGKTLLAVEAIRAYQGVDGAWYFRQSESDH